MSITLVKKLLDKNGNHSDSALNPSLLSKRPFTELVDKDKDPYEALSLKELSLSDIAYDHMPDILETIVPLELIGLIKDDSALANLFLYEGLTLEEGILKLADDIPAFTSLFDVLSKGVDMKTIVEWLPTVLENLDFTFLKEMGADYFGDYFTILESLTEGVDLLALVQSDGDIGADILNGIADALGIEYDLGGLLTADISSIDGIMALLKGTPFESVGVLYDAIFGQDKADVKRGGGLVGRNGIRKLRSAYNVSPSSQGYVAVRSKSIPYGTGLNRRVIDAKLSGTTAQIHSTIHDSGIFPPELVYRTIAFGKTLGDNGKAYDFISHLHTLPLVDINTEFPKMEGGAENYLATNNGTPYETLLAHVDIYGWDEIGDAIHIVNNSNLSEFNQIADNADALGHDNAKAIVDAIAVSSGVDVGNYINQLDLLDSDEIRKASNALDDLGDTDFDELTTLKTIFSAVDALDLFNVLAIIDLDALDRTYDSILDQTQEERDRILASSELRNTFGNILSSNLPDSFLVRLFEVMIIRIARKGDVFEVLKLISIWDNNGKRHVNSAVRLKCVKLLLINFGTSSYVERMDSNYIGESLSSALTYISPNWQFIDQVNNADINLNMFIIMTHELKGYLSSVYDLHIPVQLTM